jgi:LPXTG-site transpeptidase (sortase) family protein
MQLKNSSKPILSVALAGLVIILVLFFNFFLQGQNLSVINRQTEISSKPFILNAAALPKQEQASLPDDKADFGLPMRLKIPGINVDAAVEPVGLTSEGLMDVPKDSADVAWYNLGQRPGENGSAVMAGHYGLKNEKVPAFDNLHKLLPGDKLYVEDDRGIIISFAVRESRSYDPSADASAVFSSNDGKSHLNLIACEGIWDKIAGNYPKRLVIFTDKE